MNRRTFLLLSAVAPLMAKDFITVKDEVYLNNNDIRVLKSLKNRLKRVIKYIGYGHFNYVSFDDMLFYGRNYSSIGRFTKEELDLVDKLFYSNPNDYGFYGEKTITKITHKIAKKDIIKVPYSGHYLFRGKPIQDYNQIIKDVNRDLILTSGIRNVVKQLSLYVGKLDRCNGNISKASRSIAPPSYSYHSISDFDVGKKGWGHKNFTAAFSKTKEYKQIRKLDYVGIRYFVNNKDGVRFEPWHIKVS
ncbi:MAG: M15 family metallopeptidase [Campylobacterota bacterium]|nr:M15 family metallopeptidase [Campylobacterota bacterium]